MHAQAFPKLASQFNDTKRQAVIELAPTRPPLWPASSTLSKSNPKMDTNSTEFEVVLFRSVIQHRPVGRGRHFSMAGMLSTLSQELGPKFQGISNEDVWAALERFYNLRELDVLVRLSTTSSIYSFDLS